MDKQQVIEFIESQIAAGVVTRADVALLAQEQMMKEQVPTPVDHSKNITSILYGIGALIAIVGVGVLVGQNWEEIGFVGRMLVSVGIALLTYSFGLTLGVGPHRILSQVLFFTSALLAPLGAFVLLDEAAIEMTSGVQWVTALLLTTIFTTALFITRRTVLLLISLGYATWWYYAFIASALSSSPLDEFYVVRTATIFLGLSYLLVGYGCRSFFVVRDEAEGVEQRRIQDLIYGAGTAALLGAGMSFGGVWDVLLIAPIFAAFYGSTYLKSRSMLIVAGLFLIGHIINLTSKYFIDTIGWPIALIVVGFMIIGIGYGTLSLGKKMSRE
jgi:uncharacterized membrane protein